MILQKHQKEMNEIEDIMFAMEKNFEESEAEARQEFHSLRDEIKNKVGRWYNQRTSSRTGSHSWILYSLVDFQEQRIKEHQRLKSMLFLSLYRI